MVAIEAQMAAGDFWSNQDRAQASVAQLKSLRSVVNPLKDALSRADDLSGLLEILAEDDSVREEVVNEIQRLEQTVAELNCKA